MSPFKSLLRAVAPRLFARSYDAAQGGRRWKGAGVMPSQQAAGLAARATIAQRARYQVGNNTLAAAGVQGWVSNLIGTGIKPQSAHPDPTVRAGINAAFERWTDVSDADGLTDFYGLQSLAAHRMVTDGEALALTISNDRGELQIRLLDPEQLDGSMSRDLPGGGRIIAGVEFDEAGNRVAFHIFKDRPGLSYAHKSERIPASDVIHIFRPDAPGQVRGVSWFAPVLLRLAEHDQSIDAQLVRQKIGALLAGFIVDPEGGAAGFGDGTPSATGVVDGGLEPGTLRVLSGGKDIRFSDPPEIGQEAIAFMSLTAREIASGLGVPYEILTGDLSAVNYSSIRAGLVEFRRRCEALQHGVIAFQMLRPIWRRWLALEILSGRIKMDATDEAARSVRWITPKQAWVDPAKDVEAEISAIGAGLMSRREAVAARGLDVEALDAEIASDQVRAKSLGLEFNFQNTGGRNAQKKQQ